MCYFIVIVIFESWNFLYLHIPQISQSFFIIFSYFIVHRYFLQPRDSAGKHHRGDLGTLRLNLHYTSDYVFSSQSYDSLRNLILQSAAVEVCYFLLVGIPCIGFHTYLEGLVFMCKE